MHGFLYLKILVKIDNNSDNFKNTSKFN